MKKFQIDISFSFLESLVRITFLAALHSYLSINKRRRIFTSSCLTANQKASLTHTLEKRALLRVKRDAIFKVQRDEKDSTESY